MWPGVLLMRLAGGPPSQQALDSRCRNRDRDRDHLSQESYELARVEAMHTQHQRRAQALENGDDEACSNLEGLRHFEKQICQWITSYTASSIYDTYDTERSKLLPGIRRGGQPPC